MEMLLKFVPVLVVEPSREEKDGIPGCVPYGRIYISQDLLDSSDRRRLTEVVSAETDGLLRDLGDFIAGRNGVSVAEEEMKMAFSQFAAPRISPACPTGTPCGRKKFD